MEKQDKLKIELFDIRRELDVLDARRQQLINLYNSKIKELMNLENKSKDENSNSIKKQKRAG